MGYYGINALVRIVSHFSFIYLAFWSMQSLRTDTIFKRVPTPQIRMFLVLTAIAIGYLASSFVLESMGLFQNYVSTILPK